MSSRMSNERWADLAEWFNRHKLNQQEQAEVLAEGSRARRQEKLLEAERDTLHAQVENLKREREALWRQVNAADRARWEAIERADQAALFGLDESEGKP